MADLGLSALVTASHICMILAVILVFAEAQRVLATPGGLARVMAPDYSRFAVSTVFSALIVERCYYIFARLLAPAGVDLWSSHPAPELLSAILTASIFNLVVASRRAVRDGPDWIEPVVMQGFALAVLWLLAASLLF